MTETKNWMIKGKEITVKVESDKFYPEKVHTNLFHYVFVQGKLVPMLARTNKEEFFQDCTIQIQYLENTKFSEQDFFDCIIFASLKHIEKYNRIFLVDLWSYINVCMFILQATKGKFHNIYKSDEEALLLRDAFEHNAKSGLSEYLIIN
jgi:hypothetical protein